MTLHRPLYCNPYANLLEVTLPHCSYLDIYISRKIRLCIVFGRQMSNQTTGQTPQLFGLIIQIYYTHFSSIFLQNLSNPVLFTHCCCYVAMLTCLNYDFCIKCQNWKWEQSIFRIKVIFDLQCWYLSLSHVILFGKFGPDKVTNQEKIDCHVIQKLLDKKSCDEKYKLGNKTSPL